MFQEREVKEVVMRILKDHKACLSHELTDRAWQLFGLKFDPVNKAMHQLFSEEILGRKIEPSPYGKPFHFYFLQKADSGEVNRTIRHKLELLRIHAKRTEDVGRFAEILVGRIIEGLGYTDVKVRKESHEGVGIGRMEIDVWGKHPKDTFYQNIEVKNRRQPVNVSDVKEVEAKTAIAHTNWRLPVKSALVCSFIYGIALSEAGSTKIPVVITKKVYVPNRYGEFYTEYKNALGAYYIEIADLEDPPDYLAELIEKYILQYRYDSPKISPK